MNEYIPLLNFFVGVLTLGVLFWYAWLTMKLKNAATEQVEAMAKPCLTIWAKLRSPVEAIQNIHGAVGGTVVRTDDGTFVAENIGTGVALNVTYRFNNLDAPDRNRLQEKSYLLNVLPRQRIAMPEPVNASRYSGNCEVIFSFESIGGRHYQSTVTLNNKVLTAFRLKAV